MEPGSRSVDEPPSAAWVQMEDTGGDVDRELFDFDVPPTTWAQRWWWAVALPALGAVVSLAWALAVLPPVSEPRPATLAACATEGALDHVPYCRGKVDDVERLGLRATPKPPPLLLVPERVEPPPGPDFIECSLPPPMRIEPPAGRVSRHAARQAVLGTARVAMVGEAQRRIVYRHRWNAIRPSLLASPLPFAASALLVLPLIAVGSRRPRAHQIAVGAHDIQVDDRRFLWSELLTARLTAVDRAGRCTLVLEPERGRAIRVRLHTDPADAERLAGLLRRFGPESRDWAEWLRARHDARGQLLALRDRRPHTDRS